MFIHLVILIILNAAFAIPAFGQNPVILFHEDFNDLSEWEPLNFPNIKEHTLYSIEKENEASYLKAESKASASGVIYKKEFNVFEFPKIKWKWKVSNVYEKGNAMERSGDDYPVRIYIVFKYDPETASLEKKIKYGLMKSIYGKYPPDSSLTYIWANRPHAMSIITNPYSSEAKMIPLQSGAENARKWIEEEADILEDYHKAFREDPPAGASIAIMNDSDNTGESAVSYIDFIEVYRGW